MEVVSVLLIEQITFLCFVTFVVVLQFRQTKKVMLENAGKTTSNTDSQVASR
jgi:hypothetical protein